MKTIYQHTIIIVFTLLLLPLQNGLGQSLKLTGVFPLSAAPGSSIDMQGTGFDAAAGDHTVSFIPAGGGTATDVTPTSITGGKVLTAEVPSIPGGNYNISVTRNDGTSDTLATLFGVATGGGYILNASSNQQVVSTIDNAIMTIARDLDLDGHPEIIAIGGGVIGWHQNNGDGTFGNIQNISNFAIQQGSSVTTNDINGDGKPDIITTSLDDKIGWYENQIGEAGADADNFGDQQLVSDLQGVPTMVKTADLDMDGDLDVVAASTQDSTIAWYANDGTGNFGAMNVISTLAKGAFAIHVADLNADGIPDLVSGSPNDDKIAWYENLGGDFGDPATNQRVISTNADLARSVFATDLDGDGDLDVLSASVNDNKIAWYENQIGESGADSDGFGSQQIVSNEIKDATMVKSGDIDADGDFDILSASQSDGTIEWFENDGTGNFGERTLITNLASGASSVFVKDIDGDGDLDALSSSSSDSKIAWYTNGGPPALKLSEVFPRNSTKGQIVAIRGIGFDPEAGNNTVTFIPTDGGTSTDIPAISITGIHQIKVEIPAGLDGGNYRIRVTRASDATSDTLTILFSVIIGGDSFGNISTNQKIITTAAERPEAVFAADINNDGFEDVVYASFNDDKIAWQQNDGTGNFGSQQVISTAADGPVAIFAADLNGDGLTDVISASQNDDIVAWYENQGGGTFGPQQDISTGKLNPSSVLATDFNRDGHPDILAGFSTENEVVWFKNDGNGNFDSPITLTTSSNGVRSVFTADLDGDGDPDVLTAPSDNNEIRSFENIVAEPAGGNLSFTNSTQITNSVIDPRSVFAADVDLDGDLDVLSASMDDDKIAWYENDGTGNFGSQQIISTAANAPVSLFVTDLNGDGNPDPIAAAIVDDRIGWFKNQGAGSFGNQSSNLERISTAVDNPVSVFAADLDNDGDLDVLSASQFDNKIAWYENAKAPDMNSVTFNGSDGLLSIPHSTDFDGFSELTVEAWINSADPTTRQGIMEKHVSPSSGWWIDLNTDISTAVVTPNGSIVSSSAINPQANTWYHVAVVYDGNQLKIFVNGADETMEGITGSGAVTDNTNPVNIGDLNWTTAPFNGLMDEMRIWNTARTPQQIRNNMFQALEGDEAGLVTYLPFEQSSGTIADDQTSNNLNATFSGGAGWSSDTHPFGTVITGSEGWRMMSSPVGGASYGALLDTLWTQGFTGSDSPNFGDPNVLTWNEAAQSFEPVADAANMPAAGTGFITFVFDDQDFDGTPEGFPKSVFTGAAQNSGVISPTLSFTDTGSPALEITDDARDAGGVFLKQPKRPIAQISFTLKGAEKSSSTILMLASEAQTGKDRLDAWKLAPLSEEYLSVFTQLENGKTLDINALPAGLNRSLEIPLGIEGTELSGSFHLHWRPEALPAGWQFTLADRQTGSEYDLGEADSLDFTMQQTAQNKTTERQSGIQPVLTQSPRLLASPSEEPARFTLLISPGEATPIEEETSLPQQVELAQNFPNPFNPTTTIRFALPASERVSLEVYDVLGRRVAELINNEVRSAGSHTITFDASRLASGVYMYQLRTASGNTITKKLTLIK